MINLNEYLFQFNLNILTLFFIATIASLFFWKFKKPKQIKILLLFVFFAFSVLPSKSFSIPQNGDAQVKESQSEKPKKAKDSGKSKKDSKKDSKNRK